VTGPIPFEAREGRRREKAVTGDVKMLAAGLAIGLGAIGPGIGIGLLVARAMKR